MRRSLPFALLLLAAATAPGTARAETARFIVFFGSWSALIEPAAQQVVAAAAAAAKQDATAPISITGYASTVGGAEANKLLSQLRAQMVSDELVADGIDANRIVLTATGATNFMIEPVESRRALIEIGNK
jgi:outer membrane protein OmpA-like peptidoglycan-associated protein